MSNMSGKSMKKTTEEMLEDESFKSLSSQKNTISIILTILELVLYFGFIALIAFNKPFLSQKLSGCNNDRDTYCGRNHHSFHGYLPVSTSIGRTTNTMFWSKKLKKR